MRSVKRKLYVLCIFLALVSPAVFSTGTSEASEEVTKEEPVVVDFAMIGFQNEIEGWTAMVEAANKQLEGKIRINIERINANGWPEYYQKIVTQMAAGSPPDIIRVAESLFPRMIERNQLVDLTPYIDELDMTKYASSPFKNAGFKDGKYYNVPSGVYHLALYYNKDIFDRAGVPYPSTDWNDSITFSEVREAGKTLTSGEGANKTWGFYAGPYMAYIGMYALSAGGENVFNEDGTSVMNSREVKDVYRWFDAMLREDKTQPTPTATRVVGAWDMFKNGKLAMMVENSWIMNDFKNIDSFDKGIAAPPSKNGSAYSSQFVDGFAIPRGSSNPDAAWQAIKALISKEGFEALVPTGTGGMPIHLEVLKEQSDLIFGTGVDKKSQQAFIDGLSHTVSVPYRSFYDEADQKVNANLDSWLLGKITVDEFAEKVHGILQDYIEN